MKFMRSMGLLLVLEHNSLQIKYDDFYTEIV